MHDFSLQVILARAAAYQIRYSDFRDPQVIVYSAFLIAIREGNINTVSSK